VKELMERPQYVKYMSGQQIPAREFNNGGLDIFTTYVWPDFQRDHVGRQLSFNIEGFEGDVYYTKARPILTPEKQHLAEVRELKNGVSRIV